MMLCHFMKGRGSSWEAVKAVFWKVRNVVGPQISIDAVCRVTPVLGEWHRGGRLIRLLNIAF